MRTNSHERLPPASKSLGSRSWPKVLSLVVGYSSLLLSALERDAVIDDQGFVLAPLIADAVAGVERARFGHRQGEARRHIAEAVMPAKPIGDETHPLCERLFVTHNGPAITAIAACASDETITTAGHARPIRAFYFLADDGVEQPERICARAVRHRRIEDAAARRRHALGFVVIELELDVRLNLNR